MLYLQKFYEYISRYNVLYHSTSHSNLIGIIKNNTLKANTTIPSRKLGNIRFLYGTSTTRDKNLYFLGRDSPVIMFNDKIYTNNKIISFNYHQSDLKDSKNGTNKYEKEEFIIGDVKNVINKIECVNWLSTSKHYNLFRTIFETYNDGSMDSFISIKHNNIPLAIDFNIISDLTNIESYLNDLKEYVDINIELYHQHLFNNDVKHLRYVINNSIKDYNIILDNKLDVSFDSINMLYEDKIIFYLIFSNFRYSDKYFNMVNDKILYETINDLISDNNLSILKYFDI